MLADEILKQTFVDNDDWDHKSDEGDGNDSNTG